MSIVAKPTAQSTLHFVADKVRGEWSASPYHTMWADKSLHRWQQGNSNSKKDYIQRVEAADIITVQIHATTNIPMRVLVYADGGKFLRFIPDAAVTTVPGNTYTDGTNSGNPQQLYTHHLQFSFSEFATFAGFPATGGVYWIVAELKWPAGTGIATEQTIRMASEPVWIRSSWPGTVLIEAKHRKNANEFIWEQTGAISALRVPGSIIPASEEAAAEVYLDNGNRPTLLKANPTEAFELKVLGLPEFMCNKIAQLFGCSEVAVDNKKVVQSGNLNLGEQTQRRRSITATLLLSDPRRLGLTAFAPADGLPIPTGSTYIFKMPTVYSWTVNSVTVNGVAMDVANTTIANAAAFNAFVDNLNALRRSVGLYGRFVAISGQLVFIPSVLAPYKAIVGNVTGNGGGSSDGGATG